jgi:hypothetical protein
MTDWKAVAEARGLDIPPGEVAKFALALDALEASLRPLLKDLPRAYAESE